MVFLICDLGGTSEVSVFEVTCFTIPSTLLAVVLLLFVVIMRISVLNRPSLSNPFPPYDSGLIRSLNRFRRNGISKTYIRRIVFTVNA